MGSFFSNLGEIYAASSGCSTTGLTDSDRQVITNLHNNFRSSLAKGQEPTASGGNAPTAKNMYKIQYDCDLEGMAQSWANKCVFQHSGGNAGENLYMQTNNVAVSTALTNAADMWWAELAQYGGVTSSSTNFVFTDQTGHFTQMAWGDTTKLGCGVQWCGKMKIVVCNYLPAGNYIGEIVYEMGNPCSADKQCTTYSGSTCDGNMGLCQVPGYPQAQTSAPFQPTQAPPQPPLGASTPSPSISCSNLQLDSDCTFWASQGDCNPGSGWETWMAQNCAKTCGTCSNPDPNTPNLPVGTTQQPNQNCANIESDSNCNSWASTGICSSSLSQYCQKSCGLCSTTFLPLRTTKSHVPKPTKAQSINQCKNKDNDANCTYYAYLGFCKKASYASYMAQNCKKSCNLC